MVGEGGRVFHSEHGVKGLRLVGHGGGMGGGAAGVALTPWGPWVLGAEGPALSSGRTAMLTSSRTHIPQEAQKSRKPSFPLNTDVHLYAIFFEPVLLFYCAKVHAAQK